MKLRNLIAPPKRVVLLFSVLFLFISSVLSQPAPHSASAFPEGDPEELGFDAERLGRLSNVLREYSEQQRISGAVALVLRGGQIAFFEAAGYRDVESRDPMTRDAIFRIASQTKAVVSVGIMIVNHFDGFRLRPGAGFGLGFEVVTDLGIRGVPGAVGDFGWGGAYHSTYWASPQDDLVVVFFTQLIPATGSDLQGKLRALLYQALIR